MTRSKFYDELFNSLLPYHTMKDEVKIDLIYHHGLAGKYYLNRKYAEDLLNNILIGEDYDKNSQHNLAYFLTLDGDIKIYWGSKFKLDDELDIIILRYGVREYSMNRLYLYVDYDIIRRENG